MFRTVPLSTIGSFSLYTQQWCMSYRFADSLRAGSGRTVQGVQLKSGPYFNMSNLFTKLYTMLYYTTNLNLQKVLEMMSIHCNALIDTFQHAPRNFS